MSNPWQFPALARLRLLRRPKPPDDYDYIDDLDEEEEHDPGDDCGRWSNGRLTRSCALAGTEFCDFMCPYRDK